MAIFENSYEERPHDEQPKKAAGGWRDRLVLTIDDDSLEGVGIRRGEEVIVEVCTDMGRRGRVVEGSLVCFANRHNELMIGRYAPPYIELPYRDWTYRIGIGDRRVVGVLVRG